MIGNNTSMLTADECLERSGKCFRKSERATDLVRLEMHGLVILGYALWERAIDLGAQAQTVPAG
jgi:hypothetical protein